jgi:hypothetical protein
MKDFWGMAKRKFGVALNAIGTRTCPPAGGLEGLNGFMGFN